MNKPIRYIIIRGLALLFLWGCAAIQAPSGGPKDTTPPDVVAVSPLNESTHFSGGEIVLTFSEYIDRNSIKSSLSIVPRLEQEPEVGYHGKSFTLTLPGSLEANRTYVITFGRDLRDEHNVQLTEPIQLAFATGDSINRGSISGEVVRSLENDAVQLWQTPGDSIPDSLLTTLPQYTTDVAEDGSFKFRYLSPGIYTMAAVGQEGRGRAIDPGRMRYGLSWYPSVTIDSSESVSGLAFRLRLEPQPLKIRKGNWEGLRWGTLTFNRPADSLHIPDNLTLAYQDSTGQVFHETPILYPDARDSTRWVMESKSGIPDQTIDVRWLESVSTDSGIRIDSLSLSLRVPAEIDTTALTLITPTSSLRFAPEKERQPDLDIVFSKPVYPVPSPRLYPLVYTKSDTESVPVTINRISPLHWRLTPFNPWRENTEYFIEFLQTGYTAYDSTTFADSLVSVSFKTTETIGYGGLHGRVVFPSRDRLIAHIKSIENPQKSWKSVVNSQSLFHFKEVPEGPYSLMVFADRDHSNAYTFGTAIPPTAAEWFYRHPDTLEIRANWDVELLPIPALSDTVKEHP